MTWPLALMPCAVLLFLPLRVPRSLAAMMRPLGAVRKAWLDVLPAVFDSPTTWPKALTANASLGVQPKVPKSLAAVMGPFAAVRKACGARLSWMYEYPTVGRRR